jgi:hypothetical protein
MAPSRRAKSKNLQPQGPGLKVPVLTSSNKQGSHACKSLQRIHRVRDRHWPPHSSFTTTFLPKSRLWIGSRSFPRITWWMVGGRSTFSPRSLEQHRVVQHGVSMYFSSPEKPNREHLKRLKALVQRTKTAWRGVALVLFQSRQVLPADPYTFLFASLLVLTFGPGTISLDFALKRGRRQRRNENENRPGWPTLVSQSN